MTALRVTALRRSATAGLAVLALTGTLSLAACGDEEPKPKTETAPCGLKDTRKGHLTIKNATAALAKSGAGRITQRFRQELTVGDRSAAIEGVVDASPEKLYALEQTMPGDDGTVKLILVDDKLYVSAEGEQDGKFYVVDPANTGDPLAVALAPVLDGAGTSTGSAWTAGLLAIRYVGEETLDDGTRTEFYEFDVDSQLAARAAGEELAADAPRITTSYVWIDKYDLIRKVSTTIGDERTVETYTDFCEPLDIEAPDPEDILER